MLYSQNRERDSEPSGTTRLPTGPVCAPPIPGLLGPGEETVTVDSVAGAAAAFFNAAPPRYEGRAYRAALLRYPFVPYRL